MRALVVPLVVMILAVAFAGCVGDDDASEPQPTDTDGTIAVTDTETGQTRLFQLRNTTFGDMDPIAIGEAWEGTFEVGQDATTGEVLGMAGQDVGGLHTYDITEYVPNGVPVLIRAEMNAEMAEGDLDLWIHTPPGEAWTFAGESPFGGNNRVEWGLVHTSSDPISLMVFYDEPETGQTVDYTLAVEIRAHPELILPGIPATVEVPRGSVGLHVAFIDEPGPVMVWDPRDRYVGTFTANDTTAEVPLPADGRGGEYVVLTAEGVSGPARVQVVAPADDEDRGRPLALGLLTQVITDGDPVPFAANEDVTVTADLTVAPIQVAFVVRMDTITDGYDIMFSSPERELITRDATFTPPAYEASPDRDMGFGFWTDIGVEGLVPGTYTGTFTGGTHGEGHALIITVHYAR